jgi:diaminopimelate decarboxylase
VKANPNLAVLATLARLGAGADVVSGGEMARALAAGVPAERIVFSGVGKTRAELAAGVEAGILQFNVESEAEIDMLAQVAAAKSATVEIAIRINPAVDPKTHGKISTGGADAKFGIPWERLPAAFAQAAAHPNLRPVGLAAHIGSQLTDLGPVEDAIRKLGDLARELEALGHKIKRVDVGGGLGVPYRRDQPAPPSPTDYAAMVARATAGWPWQLMFEPGRMIVGNAGVLVSEVILTKDGASKHFVVVDAAMNDLLRPSLYGAWHDILAVRPKDKRTVATVVGPICETGDTFAEDREIEDVQSGDLVAFMTAGAYGATMASTYNSRPLVPEVMVKGDEWAIVSQRNQPAAMLALDAKAPWL